MHITLFCNILDNAYESASQSAEGFIDLYVRAKDNTPFTLISLRNSCADDPIDKKTHSLKTTTKEKPENHGYGMKSIYRVVEKYNGGLTKRVDESISAWEQFKTEKVDWMSLCKSVLDILKTINDPKVMDLINKGNRLISVCL